MVELLTFVMLDIFMHYIPLLFLYTIFLAGFHLLSLFTRGVENSVDSHQLSSHKVFKTHSPI